MFRVFAIAATIGLGAISGGAADLDFAIRLQTETISTESRTTVRLATATPGTHVLIQFSRPITDDERDALARDGIALLSYVPNYAYTARIDRVPSASTLTDYEVRYLNSIEPRLKISPLLTSNLIAQAAITDDQRLRLTVILHAGQDRAAVGSRLGTDAAVEIVAEEPTINALEVIADPSRIDAIAGFDEVVWVEPSIFIREEHNAGARGQLGVNTLQIAPYNLDGDGVTIGEWDGGNALESHNDFGGRVIRADFAGISDHATHVAGTVIGDGSLSGGTHRGMAPAGRLITYLWWGSGSEALSEYTAVVNSWNGRVATNSWGYGVNNPTTGSCEGLLGNYYSVSATLDNIVRGAAGEPIPIMWSAGNQRGGSSQYCGSIGYSYGTVTPPGTSKNTITVGAINSNNNSMTGFSSWGPTDDGRIKPDVVGPGCQTGSDWGITSTSASGGYTVKCGTSMSTPAVAGVVMLMRQQWDATFGGTILPSTIKGILINSAKDFGNTGPDYAYGHGAVDAVAAIDKLTAGATSYLEDSISTGQSKAFTITVPSGTSKLRVSLVWDDPGGSGIGGQTLINDLDLRLVEPSSTEHFPYVLDPANPSFAATRGVDRINNVESAEVTNPAPGIWQAVVEGFNIPTGPQAFSLVFSPDSIHTPGQVAAVEVIEVADPTVDPGATDTATFWVRNLAAMTDSISISVGDTRGWLTGGTLDTTVLLGSFDSVAVQRIYDVPPGALVAEPNTISCVATSLTQSVATSTEEMTVFVAAVYEPSLSDLPASDTVFSPSTLPFTVRVTNNGNDRDDIAISGDLPATWALSPSAQTVTLDPGADAVVAFDLLVPAEVPDLELSVMNIIASADDLSSADTASFSVTTLNPFFPPTLQTPSPETYQQSRTPTFSWTADGWDSFTLYLASDPNMTSIERIYPGLTATSYAIQAGDELTDGIYYWGVRKFVGGDSSSLQAVAPMIGIDNTAPRGAVALTPENNTIISSSSTELTFMEDTIAAATVVVAPEYYRIDLAADSAFTSNLTTLENLTSSSTPVSSVNDGRWFWRVQRYDDAGNQSSWSETRSFLLDTTPPAIATLLEPTSGTQLTNPGSIVFKWTGSAPVSWETTDEYFYVHVARTSNFGDFDIFANFVHADSITLEPSDWGTADTLYWRVKSYDSAGFTVPYSAPFTVALSSFVCGDVDFGGDGPDLADLSALIDYLFVSFTPLANEQAADVDCQGGVSLTDLSTLIDHLFITFAPLCCQ